MTIYGKMRKWILWFAGIILGIAAFWGGLIFYVPFLQRGTAWWDLAIKRYVASAILFIIYLAVPQRAWGWLGDTVKLLWKRVRHGRSI